MNIFSVFEIFKVIYYLISNKDHFNFKKLFTWVMFDCLIVFLLKDRPILMLVYKAGVEVGIWISGFEVEIYFISLFITWKLFWYLFCNYWNYKNAELAPKSKAPPQNRFRLMALLTRERHNASSLRIIFLALSWIIRNPGITYST